MKRLYIGLGAVLAVLGLVGGIVDTLRKFSRQSSDDIDGGVVTRTWADAPKVIASQDIVDFHCVISLFAACDVPLPPRIYKLDAVLRDGAVLVRWEWRDRAGAYDAQEYTTESEFLSRLQGIVGQYALAQYNGYYHSVSGLPDFYGESLDILYASGENIHVYDNQSGFLPPEAVQDLILQFGAAKSDNHERKDAFSARKVGS